MGEGDQGHRCDDQLSETMPCSLRSQGVLESFKWYQSLLGLPETTPAHDDFGQILDSDGTVLLCLHKWGAHEHPSLTSPYRRRRSAGISHEGEVAAVFARYRA